jgi:hypothetical protein
MRLSILAHKKHRTELIVCLLRNGNLAFASRNEPSPSERIIHVINKGGCVDGLKPLVASLTILCFRVGHILGRLVPDEKDVTVFAEIIFAENIFTKNT